MKPGPRVTPRQAGAVNAPIQHERRRVAARLAAAGCIAADLEAIELCSAAENAAALEESVARRERGEPLAWITGVTRFCGRRLRVDAGVYVPRPQSEAMAEMAADRLPPGGTAVDLCTGTGAIAHHLRHRAPGATVIAVDCDIRAVRCATRNGVAALLGDLGAALRSDSFDVVTAVAPYVPTGHLRHLPTDVRDHEPQHALHGGADGLDIVRRVIRDAGRILRPGGRLFIEIGAGQDALLGDALHEHRLTDVVSWTDADGDVRGLAATLSGERGPAMRSAVP